MFSSNTSQVSSDANWIEECFQTHLYTGTDATQTITNGIDLAGKGGLVWTKTRSDSGSNWVTDSARGNFRLNTNATSAQSTTGSVTFNSNGFTVDSTFAGLFTYASWTFRKQKKFFDVVTYTGDDNSNHVIPHNLGSVPGCIIVKQTSGAGAWFVRHRSVTNIGRLNLTNSFDLSQVLMYPNLVTDTSFAVNYELNTAGKTYVAYLFAHDAGGFGLTGTDNVISCGSFTTSSYYATVNLGYEPQWILYKRTDSTVDGDWQIADNMRGLLATANSPFQGLQPNLSAAESSTGNIQITSTGFVFGGAAASPYIYIAIRRGPMKVPTDATKVFSPNVFTTNNTITTNFPVDLSILKLNKASTSANQFYDRLRGAYQQIFSNSTAAEATNGASPLFDNNTGTVINAFTAGLDSIGYSLKRAPSTFDEVCYTGNGGSNTLTHNLGVAPELIIFKSRSASENWVVLADFGPIYYRRGYLDLTNSAPQMGYGGALLDSKPTATSISLLGGTGTNSNATTYVAYLFATCPNVSKVGTFTGNGSTQAIACGFTGGARFVMIKAVSTTGNWLIFDTARGMNTSTDPWLALNSTAAESSTTGACTTTTGGFTVDESKLTGVNTNGVSYIFLSYA
jgi:hypothetical protein